MRIGRRYAVLHAPQVPVIHDGPREKDADASRERDEHREPPRPSMDRFHRRVESHRPTPEERGAFGGCAPIEDLLDLALTAVPSHRQDRPSVHREEQCGSVKEGDREHVKRIVEQIAVSDGERRGPVQMRENTERPITIEVGSNEIAGTDPEKILGLGKKALSGKWKKCEVPDLWDGLASERIVKILEKCLV